MAWLILSVFLWGMLHSILASHPAKNLARHWLGERFMRFYRLAYNLFAGFSFIPVLLLAARLPQHALYRVPWPWAIWLYAGQFLALAALVAGFLQTDPWEFLGLRQLKETGEVRRATLVTAGLYRHVRHPLYTSGLAFIWLLPVMTTTLLMLNIGLTLYIIIGAIFEERKLQREFGQSYSDYAAVTPMLIPFLPRNKS